MFRYILFLPVFYMLYRHCSKQPSSMFKYAFGTEKSCALIAKLPTWYVSLQSVHFRNSLTISKRTRTPFHKYVSIKTKVIGLKCFQKKSPETSKM